MHAASGEADTRLSAEPIVAVALITRAHQVLMVRRSRPEGDLTWQFPAGKSEPGEAPEDTVVRETFEEVGLVVLPQERLGERLHPVSHRYMVYFSCNVVAGEAYVKAQDEIAAVAWCTLAEADERVAAVGGIFAPVRCHLERVLRTTIA